MEAAPSGGMSQPPADNHGSLSTSSTLMSRPDSAGWRLPWFIAVLPPLLAATLAACVQVRHVDVEAVDTRRDSTSITTPVKVHLRDGSTVVYADGVGITRDSLRGTGMRFGLTGRDSASARAIPADSIAAMESFTTRRNQAATIVLSTVVGVGAVVGTVALLKAVFGSCPTVYADSAGTPLLEGEEFSYSIAPLFERRDVHLLRAMPDAAGHLRLEVRNEALETHYINHLQLLEVRHAAAESVLPTGDGALIAVRDARAPAVAVDRAGRDVRLMLSRPSPRPFATDPRTLAAIVPNDMDDWIDLSIATPPGTDSVALVFDLRNSLLNTVLLYDFLLGAQGVGAVDWVGGDLGTIGGAVELGRWYGSRMGMHVLVRQGGAYKNAAYVPDAGPIAWRRVAAVVRAVGEDSLHVRLRFAADQWRIRGLQVSTAIRPVTARGIALARVVRGDGTLDSAATANVRDSDARYLSTGPGQRFFVEWDSGSRRPDSASTFLLGSQGYYIEWIRGDWLQRRSLTTRLTPSDSLLFAGLQRWRAVGPEFQRRFDATRIPVR